MVTDAHAVDEGERFAADTTTSFGPVSVGEPPNNRPEASAPVPAAAALPLSDLMPRELGGFECAAQNCSLVLPSCARPDEDGHSKAQYWWRNHAPTELIHFASKPKSFGPGLADFSSAGASKIMLRP